ncbi:MAG: response regulator [Verrucomicrobia bacterium]|nr:response regulator [Verrucomicrobiota bacterium]
MVDHDPYVCHLSADVLIRHGYEVNAAEDGAAGWEELQAYHYDLLITERDLPKISGVTLVRRLRAARLALPVVMVAKRLPARELARNPALQLAAALLKPLPVDALLDTVTIVLRATGSPRERILPPPNSQSQSSADGWQLKPITTAANSAQVHPDLVLGYHRWGLNE